ncbi:MAG TPA: DUF1588 domain-containing protein [Gammaproteobacteria bacterium]|nr:DUF1588 domain-containing protein [Gammaproteobacteria bacterium]
MLFKLNPGSTSWLPLLVISSTLTLFSCMPVPSNEDEKKDNVTNDKDCTTAPDLFTETVWPSIQESCLDCHHSGGVANNTRLIFTKDSDAQAENYNILRNFSQSNAVMLLNKTIGLPVHGGGSPYVDQSQQEYQDLENLVSVMLKDCGATAEVSFFDGVKFYGEQETLKKAAIVLAGRRPTVSELNAVAAGGEDSLRVTIRNMMQGENFENFLLETANNHFLSTGITGGPALFPVASDYPKVDDIENSTERYIFYQALRQEPLQLLRYIVVNERPYSEILTADYTVVNPVLASIYEADVAGQFDDITDNSEWRKATIPNMLRFGRPFPHAGVLSTHAWLHRFPTTDSNRNRHRAKIMLRQFLGIDLEALAQRPQVNDSQFLVPTLEDPECTSCHVIMDPVAGAFQNWSRLNRYRPLLDNTTALPYSYRSRNYPKDASGNAYYQQGDNWFRDVLPPGFNGVLAPGGHEGNEAALQWLGKEIVKDSRFSMGAVHFWYHGLFGEKVLTPPTDATARDYQARLNMFNAQDEIFREIAANFSEDRGYGAYNVKDLLVDLVTSKWFRASGVAIETTAERVAELETVGSYHLLTPEQLSRKMEATVGKFWNKMIPITKSHGLLYGGFDARNLINRNISINTALNAVLDRMGNEVACDIVRSDFLKSADQRLLFPLVDLSHTPDNARGNIMLNIQYLHNHMLEEFLPLDSAELLQTYNLFQEVWSERNSAPEKTLRCNLNDNNDSRYTGRSWVIVLLYLMSDPRYIYSY